MFDAQLVPVPAISLIVPEAAVLVKVKPQTKIRGAIPPGPKGVAAKATTWVVALMPPAPSIGPKDTD
jgi:hypothetical protein